MVPVLLTNKPRDDDRRHEDGWRDPSPPSAATGLKQAAHGRDA